MPFSELTSNQFIDGIKKIFELQAFIDVDQNQNSQTNFSEEQAIGAGC